MIKKLKKGFFSTL